MGVKHIPEHYLHMCDVENCEASEQTDHPINSPAGWYRIQMRDDNYPEDGLVLCPHCADSVRGMLVQFGLPMSIDEEQL